MKISEMTSKLLTEKIPKGRLWLAQHSQQIDSDKAVNGEPYDDDTFQKNLKIYEELCDEYRRRGLDDAPIQTDEALIENEKKIRLQLANMDTHNREYIALYSQWFRLREEGLKRNLYKFFIPTSLDTNSDIIPKSFHHSAS
jgi:hypothetical protein